MAAIRLMISSSKEKAWGASAFTVLLPFGLLAWDGADLYRDIAEMRTAAVRLAKLERDAWTVKEHLDALIPSCVEWNRYAGGHCEPA